MSSFSEADHDRHPDGRFAAMSTAETPLAALGEPTPLKELDPAGLVMEIQQCTASWTDDDKEAISRALADATFLHRGQMRENRGVFPCTAYIEHPLRNAARVLRLGKVDTVMVVSALMHDVPEDCADRIARLCGHDPDTMDDHRKRAIALQWLRARHGSESGRIVTAVSNPIHDGPPLDAAAKRRTYVDHLRQSIREPKVLVIKWVDFYDNAGSLHHNKPTPKRAARAAKYLDSAPVFREQIRKNADTLDNMMGEGTSDRMLHDLDRIESRLRSISSEQHQRETA